jgi:hypothetical protein
MSKGEEKMKIEKTERGFELIEFKDIYGSECSLQQSSIAIYEKPGTSAIWFGVENNRMHIDFELLKKLLPYLQRWMKNGSFHERENDTMELSSVIACYELMDQTGLLRLKQAYETDLRQCIDTEKGVVFANLRIQIIDGILEDRKK